MDGNFEVGLYGKLPTHGDFLRRRVADDFVSVWDPWLQACLATSRSLLGDRWLETYLTSPVWRFAFGPNVCGAASIAGLLVPSVDRVGRYFPLTLVWPTPAELCALEVAAFFERGFEHAERLLVDTLARDQFDFTDFDRQVRELARHLVALPEDGALRLTTAAAVSLAQPALRPRCIPLRAATALYTPSLQLLGRHLESAGVRGLWWTDGSAVIEPSWLMTEGLPDPANFTAMLDGAWAAAGWEVGEIEVDPTATLARTTVDPMVNLRASSAGSTDRGPVRATNQDAFVDRADMGMWAVADGMGGLSDGEVASRMVCDALVDAPHNAGLDEQIEQVTDQLRAVSDYLRRSATRMFNPIQRGSTVVVLLIRQRECAVLWAGDSRAYRLRDGALSQLTEDHAWTEGAGDGADSQAITRAVGAEDTLVLEVLRSDVRPNDRFLLCSDGVSRVLDTAALAQILERDTPADGCAALIAQSAARGGTDNATAVIVDCCVG